MGGQWYYQGKLRHLLHRSPSKQCYVKICSRIHSDTGWVFNEFFLFFIFPICSSCWKRPFISCPLFVLNFLSLFGLNIMNNINYYYTFPVPPWYYYGGNKKKKKNSYDFGRVFLWRVFIIQNEEIGINITAFHLFYCKIKTGKINVPQCRKVFIKYIFVFYFLK